MGTNQKNAEAIDINIRTLDPYNSADANRTTRGLSTDAGDSVNGDRLKTYLRTLCRLSLILSFLGVTCCLHGQILHFKSPVEKHFILGGVKKRNLLQLLHAVHAL